MAEHMLQLLIEYATAKGTDMRQPQLRRMLVFTRNRATRKTRRIMTKWIKKGARPDVQDIATILLEIKNPFEQQKLALKLSRCF